MKRALFGAFLATLSLAIATAPAEARQDRPSAAVLAFAKFLARASPLCQRQPARHCVDAGWRFTDRNRDGRISAAELEAVRVELRDWLTWTDNGIKAYERRAVLLGLIVVEAIGLERLVESYDASADGQLNREELLSDLRLDARPLGEILSDSQAVDWARLRGRLGALAPALDNLAPNLKPPAE